MEDAVKLLSLGKIPAKIEDMSDYLFSGDDNNWLVNQTYRETFTKRFNMWAIVDLDWTEKLAGRLKGKRCLEVAAGFGWLSKALNHHGVNIVATSMRPTKGHICDTHGDLVFPVLDMDAYDAVEKFVDNFDVLICSWPPYKDPILNECIEYLSKYKRDVPIIYIGESCGGCTGSDEMWDLVKEVDVIDMPCWAGINDQCYILSIK